MYAFFGLGKSNLFGLFQNVLEMGLKAKLSSEKTFLIQPKTIWTNQKSFWDVKKDKVLIEIYLEKETKTSKENSNTG